jgi:hypothetical protein
LRRVVASKNNRQRAFVSIYHHCIPVKPSRNAGIGEP